MWHINNVKFIIHLGLCRIVTFVKGYVTLRQCPRFIKVYISLWHYQGLYHITTLSHGLLQCLVGICNHNQRCDTLIMWYWAFNKCYVALWRLSQVMLHLRHSTRVMSHCDICQGLCHIVIMPKMSHINNVSLYVSKY